MYLLEKAFDRMERAMQAGEAPAAGLSAQPGAVFSEQWVDVGGMLMPQDRLTALQGQVESGAIGDLAALDAALDAMHAAYAGDEWAWVRWAYREVFGQDVEGEGPAAVAAAYREAKAKFLGLVLNDATREFDAVAQTGFGADGTPEDAAAEFVAVRGDYDGNKFVREMRRTIEALDARVGKINLAAAQPVAR
jgi:hypothetical protein